MRVLQLLSLSLGGRLSAAAAAASKPRHIVFFLIDDYGFADASYKADLYEGTASPPTPAIDKLAGAGVKLESYYVNKLCSPTRTALLSGRYAYTIGQDDGVIINGQNIDIPLNLLTVADHLQGAGWKTSAYGKWDAGMTTWGSTPTCRGFDHFRGFYSAASDYYSHQVGPGYDYHNDTAVDGSASGVYTTHAVTAAVQEWIAHEVGADARAKTFAYVAHQAVHGPLQVPEAYINDACRALVPADHPSRLIYCGMVRAMDESVANITATYEALGILNDTLFVLSADNGGNPGDGGSNYVSAWLLLDARALH
jgi:arylsulfatase A-like enzyme